jgi:DNA-binding GntR family transcriptional regulator
MMIDVLGKGTTSLTDRIFNLMRDQIISFELKPFHALSDKKIAERIGVSRTPVREALARLAARGLVDIYPQRGTVVSPLRREDLERSQFIREALEVGLVQRGAGLVGRGEMIRKLRIEISLQETFAELGDNDRFYRSDEDFHRLIAIYAGLPGIWDDIQRSKVHMDRVRHLSFALEQDLTLITAQHSAIVDAIELGEEDTAADAMRVHLRRVLQFTDQILETHPEYFEGTGAASLAVKLGSNTAQAG